MTQPLVQILADAGRSAELLQTPDGSRLVLLPHGARVLGLYPPQTDENFFWTNPKLARADSARELFGGDGWQNPGGDRTWLAPELDVFFPDYPSTDTYVQPPQLDMSEYQVEREGGGVRMSRRMTLHLARQGCDVDLHLAKRLSAAADPLRHEKLAAPPSETVQYAGYTQRTVLELLGGGNAGVRVGIWNLIQLPSGGELIVPTYTRANPQTCFGSIPPRCFTIEDRLLRLKVDFPDSHKIALRAACVCGRVGYVYPCRDRWALVVRNISINPAGEYVDVQHFALDDPGYALQFCRVDNELGDFFEVEYHAPAVGSEIDGNRSEDVSQVWAFRGTRRAIDAVAHSLLGAGL